VILAIHKLLNTNTKITTKQPKTNKQTNKTQNTHISYSPFLLGTNILFEVPQERRYPGQLAIFLTTSPLLKASKYGHKSFTPDS